VSTLAARSLIDLAIGPLVREALTRAGLSPIDRAARPGTTQSAVSRWEHGHDEPRLSRLTAILAACGVRAGLTFAPDDGVDRAQIRQQLAMSPADRLASVTNVSRFVNEARRA